MKKTILILLAVAVFCGIVYVGYIIFAAVNVKEITIIGNIQQVYFVGDDINFADAKLEVYYHNGSKKIIDMNKSNVSVALFSTSGHGKYFGTMKLTYKSQTVDVDYCVLDRTSYLLSKEVKKTSTETTELQNQTQKIIDFKSNGICRYFEIKNNKYYMHDGYFDSNYNYQINGDKIIVNLGQSVTYEIKPIIDGNKIDLKAKTFKYSTENPDVLDYIIESEFETTNLIKTNNVKEDKSNKLTIDYSQTKFNIDKTNSNYPVLIVPKNKTIDESGICIKVDYDNGEVYRVYVTSAMLKGDLNYNYEGQSFHINGLYDQREFTIAYKIES